MIRDVVDLLDGEIVRGEVGVIGAGVAGIELARYLGRNGVEVVLLESGRLSFDPATQELARVESVGKPLRRPDADGAFTPFLPEIFRGEARIRQFGGTSNVWTGKWRTFDPSDFEERPWIPYSGWPIDFDDLRPFYEEVRRDYQLGDFDAFERDESIGQVRELATHAGLKLSFHVWQKEALRFGRVFLPELRRAANVDVVLGANATEIVLADDLRRVRAVRFLSLDGRKFELQAENFVLATGGIEGARLLLASNRQIPAGIGNESDLVGRFHMDHPKHKRGVLQPSSVLANPDRVGLAVRPRPRFHVTFSLASQVQSERSLLNHLIRFTPVYAWEVDYPAESVEAIRDLLRAPRAGRLVSTTLALARSPSGLRKIAQKHLHRGHGGRVHHYAAAMYVEQAPNPDSRVMLGRERDALGMPKTVVDWRFTPLDHESFRRTVDGLREAFTRAGFGRLEFGPDLPGLDDTTDGAHPMGATRMAKAPTEGVVDANCRVFGAENLFIASSSVFPTGASTAPTMTILALARRLGKHLVGLRQSRTSIAPSPATPTR